MTLSIPLETFKTIVPNRGSSATPSLIMIEMTENWWLNAVIALDPAGNGKGKLAATGEAIFGVAVSQAFPKIVNLVRDSDDPFVYNKADETERWALVEAKQSGTRYNLTLKTNTACDEGNECVPDAGFVKPNLDTAQVMTIQTRADDTGNLNDTYITLSLVDANGDQVDYYLWCNINSAGTDPNLPGRTAIVVAGATDVTANDLAAAIQVVLDAITGWTATVSTDTVTVTNDNVGECQNVLDSEAAPTTFTLATTVEGNEASEVKSTGIMGQFIKAETATGSTEKITQVMG